MGAPTGGGKGGGGAGAMKPMGTGMAPPMNNGTPQMFSGQGMPAASAGGMGMKAGVNPAAYTGQAPQSGGMGAAMNPAMQQPQGMGQAPVANDLHSILQDPTHPANPIGQIGDQMKNMMQQGEGVVKNIFSGQWKDSLGLTNSTQRTQGILGGSIANPFMGNPGTANIHNQDGMGGASATPMAQPAAQASSLPGVSPATNPQIGGEQVSPVVNVGQHIADTQQKLTSFIQAAPVAPGMYSGQGMPRSNELPQSPVSPVQAAPQPIGQSAPYSAIPAASNMSAIRPNSTGDLAASYEVSQVKGQPLQNQVGFISNGMGGRDPGGISYGRYQLETNKGTMQGFLKSPDGQQFNNLQGLKVNSPEFKSEWQKTASANPQAFDQAQFNYIKTQSYDKAVPYASDRGFDTTHPAVQQALFSTANQSGGWKNIINKSGVKPGDDIPTQINKLYDSRANYFQNLKLAPDVKASIIKNRTVDERRDALSLVGGNYGI